MIPDVPSASLHSLRPFLRFSSLFLTRRIDPAGNIGPVPNGGVSRRARNKKNLERSRLHISAFNAVAVCPGGRLESRPAIYRRYWCLELALVPEGRSKFRGRSDSN
jgi:hypothetical protein